MDRDRLHSRIGSSLRGKWTLERLLGWGGVGAVYLARHTIGRHDAIKILHPEVLELPGLRERFEVEARAANRFKHPGAVEVRDLDVTEDGVPFLVMELVEGETLSQRIRSGEVGQDALLDWTAQLLDVLAAAHLEGIVHRDIKPDNLILTAEGKLRVLDFGIARLPGTELTDPGVAIGTAAYMAPEQIRGARVDHRADLFSVGATMFRVLAGRHVHLGEATPELVFAAGARSAPPLAEVAPSVPPGLASVVDRALAFDADERYPDAATMRGDVIAVAEGHEPPFASSQSAPPSTVSLPDGGAAMVTRREGAIEGSSERTSDRTSERTSERSSAVSAVTPTAVSPGANALPASSEIASAPLEADPVAVDPAPGTLRVPTRSWSRIVALPLLALSVLLTLFGAFVLFNELGNVKVGRANWAGWSLAAMFLVPGLALTLLAFRLRRSLPDPTLRAVLRIARSRGGRIGVLELVADTSLSADDAESALSLLVREGVCRKEEGQRGAYVFEEFLPKR